MSEAVSAALRMLAAMDRTEAELRLRLLKKGFSEEEAEAAVSEMKELGYVDDCRYARSYVRSRCGEKSRMQILYALKEKGIERDRIEEALDEEMPESEIPLIEKLIAKRAPDPEETDRRERERIAASLCRKGFKIQDIRKAMDNLGFFP